MAHLKRWRRMDGNIRHVVHWNGSSIQSLKKSFRSSRKTAGLDDEVIPHSLRHTAATWLMQKGVKTGDAADFLGMSEEVLRRVYYHHHPDFQAAAAEAIGRA